MTTFELADYKAFVVDDRSYLFLVSQNAIFEADKDTVAMLDHATGWTREKPLSRRDFLSHFPGTETEKQETFERLGQIGLLHPATSPSTMKTAFTPHKIPLKTLVMHVTDACNLSCHYCYYHTADGPAGSRTMTPERARKTVDFLMEASGHLDRVELVFFGGEPLLNVKLIADVVDYAGKTAAARGKTVDFALTTNATLLNEKTVAFLKETGIGVTVSIDGLPDVHDRYRRFPDGSPSFGVILPGIRRLLSIDGGRPVVARVTVAGEVGDLSANLDYLLDLGFAEAGFAPVTSGDETYRLGPGGMDRLQDQFERLAGRFLEHARENRFLGFTNLIDLLVTLHEGEAKPYPCGAGLGLFSVSTDGELYLCQRLTGENRAAMGNIFDGFDNARLETFRQMGHLTSKPTCRECWAQVICAGGCYHEALVREGELTAPNLHYCDWIKRWIETGLGVYGRLVSENPDYLDKLCSLRGHETCLTAS